MSTSFILFNVGVFILFLTVSILALWFCVKYIEPFLNENEAHANKFIAKISQFLSNRRQEGN